MRATNRYPDYKDSYEYHGSTTIERIRKKGNVMVYAPSTKKQKYNGMITFSFTNLTKKEADKFIKRFSIKKIKKRMSDLK